jgi:hypothetical protein
VQSCADKGRINTLVLGNAHSQFNEFGHSKMGNLKIMHKPMSLGYLERERAMRSPSVGADTSKIAAFCRAS